MSIGLKTVFIHGGKKSTLLNLLITSNEVKRDELTPPGEFRIARETGPGKL